jgi:peptidoglycan-associated lipoprotein
MRSFVVAMALIFLAPGCAGKKQKISSEPPPVEAAPRAAPVTLDPPETAAPGTEEEWFRSATLEELQTRLTDVYFDYDRDELRSDARNIVQTNLAWLRKPYNTLVIELEGHCDERGTANYNLALGDRRASSVATYLQSLGFSRERLKTISYGKERPQCLDASESCWWKNRRAHFRVVSKGERSQ